MKRWIVCIIFVATLFSSCKKDEKEILVFAGAGLKEPLEEIAVTFQEETGIGIKYNFAGCGQHLSQMEMSSEGDVFYSRIRTPRRYCLRQRIY